MPTAVGFVVGLVVPVALGTDALLLATRGFMGPAADVPGLRAKEGAVDAARARPAFGEGWMQRWLGVLAQAGPWSELEFPRVQQPLRVSFALWWLWVGLGPGEMDHRHLPISLSKSSYV